MRSSLHDSFASHASKITLYSEKSLSLTLSVQSLGVGQQEAPQSLPSSLPYNTRVMLIVLLEGQDRSKLACPRKKDPHPTTTLSPEVERKSIWKDFI